MQFPKIIFVLIFIKFRTFSLFRMKTLLPHHFLHPTLLTPSEASWEGMKVFHENLCYSTGAVVKNYCKGTSQMEEKYSKKCDLNSLRTKCCELSVQPLRRNSLRFTSHVGKREKLDFRLWERSAYKNFFNFLKAKSDFLRKSKGNLRLVPKESFNF